MSTGSEVTTNHNASRFQVISVPIISPGCCGICGTVKDENGFVTTGLDFEWYGTLIFCHSCALGLAAPVGGITPEKALTLELENARLAATVVALQERLSILQPIEDYIDERLNSPVSNVPDNTDDDNVRSLPLPQEPDDEPNEAAKSTEQSDSNVAEPVSVERPDDSTDVSNDLAELLGELRV